MTKAEQYFIDFGSKTEFDAKTGAWKDQDLSVHMMVRAGRIDMWLTP